MNAATAALVMAIISLVISIASFGWQVASWFLQAARIKVHLHWGATTEGVEHMLVASKTKDLDLVPTAIDLDEYPVVSAMIVVRNRGRSPMFIQDVGVVFPSGHTYRNRTINEVVGLPYMLQPGEARSVPIPVDQLRIAWSQYDEGTEYVDITGAVQLGNGKVVRSRQLRLRRRGLTDPG